MKHYLPLLCGLTLLACAAVPARAQDDVRSRLPGLVYEVEDYTEPTSAWIENQDSPDHWNLWSQEKDVRRKRSRGASLRSPTVEKDRATPEEGAPPLHTRITGIPNGLYRAYISNPGRHMAWSLDGRDWQRSTLRREIDCGVFDITDGVFEVWVDDRYATPGGEGPCYYDYIRFEPFTPPELDDFALFTPFSGGQRICWTSSEPIDTGIVEIDSGSGFEACGEGKASGLRNHRVLLDRTVPADQRVRVRVRVKLKPDYEFVSDAVQLSRRPPFAGCEDSFSTTLRLADAPVPERAISAGVPFEPGRIGRRHEAVVESPDGRDVAQTRVLALWPDGSVKWLHVTFLPRESRREYELLIDPEHAAEQTAGLEVRQTKNTVIVRTDRDMFEFDRMSPTLPGGGDVIMTGTAGETWRLGPAERLDVTDGGPLETTVLMKGALVGDDGPGPFRYQLRSFVTRDSPLIRVQLTVLNASTEPPFTRVSDLAVRLPVSGEGDLTGVLPPTGSAKLGPSQSIAMYQIDDQRLRVTSGKVSSMRSQRAEGWAVAVREGRRLAVAVRDFWQTWPKGIAVEPDGVRIQLLPKLQGDEYTAKTLGDWTRHLYWHDEGAYLFKRGMAYRAEFWVRRDAPDDPVPGGGWANWCEAVSSLPYAAVSPQHLCGTGVLGPLCSTAETDAPLYEQMVERNHARILSLREENRAYGWMNFGDWWGERGLNWGNSEYDTAWAIALHFARTGRWDYFRTGEQMARHYSTIDTIHVPWQTDMPGRVYMHCIGHVGAETAPDLFGKDREQWDAWFDRYGRYFMQWGIEPSGHIYQEGNFAYYFLTGDRDYLNAAVTACDAQAAYLTRRFDFGIERSAGWPLSNAVAAYEATCDPFYLNAARLYIERILEKQDKSQGCWLLPQDPSECNHPPPHLGSKSFATGVLLYAMMRYDRIEPRDDVKQSIVSASNWLVDRAWNAEKKGFRYKTGCSDYIDDADSGTTQALCAAGLAYAWRLTGDERFREIARISISNVSNATGTIGKQCTQLMRQSAYALPILSDGDAQR